MPNVAKFMYQHGKPVTVPLCCRSSNLLTALYVGSRQALMRKQLVH